MLTDGLGRDANRWLVGVVLGMLALFVLNLAGLFLDPRTITGLPAWAKPAKFALSTALYAGMLAWILTKVSVWPRVMQALGTTTAVMLALELFIVNLQAARGTTSHFNVGTKLDAFLFAVMGVSILILWLASLGITVGLFRQPFSNRALGWSLRLGLLITVLGSASGGLMTQPRAGQSHGIIGSHTIGSPDGGTGLPLLGWSTKHGDLRLGHFVGLHGAQAIPLLYFVLARKRRARVSSIAVGAASYGALFFLLEWQALRGQALVQPDGLTLEAWAIWLGLSASALLVTMFPVPKKTVPIVSSVAA